MAYLQKVMTKTLHATKLRNPAKADNLTTALVCLFVNSCGFFSILGNSSLPDLTKGFHASTWRYWRRNGQVSQERPGCSAQQDQEARAVTDPSKDDNAGPCFWECGINMQVFGEGKESGPSTRHLYSYPAIFWVAKTARTLLPVEPHLGFSHLSTNQDRPCLASKTRRGWVCSGWYGCRPNLGFHLRQNGGLQYMKLWQAGHSGTYH